ncbi:MAG: MFS transporter, partial [Dehalococcoidia bacterium]|nr:MFS transporter [Dehalococcoidia bacterium]
MIPQPLMAIKRLGKNVLILSVCQALGLSGVPLVLLLGGIIGSELAPSEKWATLPIAIVVIGIALFSIPAAMVMKWIGRKRGFIISSAVGSAATLGAAFAISVQSFSLFCFMVLFIGGSTAFIAQYRFAAAESVEQKYSARAVSFVLIGGIVAGFLGPEIGRDGKDWLGFGDYTGSFVAMALMFALSGVLLLFISEKAVKKESVMEQERPLKAVVSQRTFLVA